MNLQIGSITIGCTDPERLAAFWSAALGTPVTGASEDFVFLERPPQGEPFVVLQRVTEAGAGENRVHLDLGGEPRSEAVERLTALGAILIAEHTPPGAAWTVMADPEGNQFCVT